MTIRRLAVSPTACRAEELTAAAGWLRAGGLVVYPTDTLYAVAADPTSPTAIEALFDWKGRAAEAALPLVAASMEQVEVWFGPLGGMSGILARRFWPGPLSLILPAGARLVESVHAGRGTVAVRVPDSVVARALADAWQGPLPSTSANRTGAPAVDRVSALAEMASDRRVLIIDAGPSPGGLPSTIVDARTSPPVLVREGAVPWTRVLKSIHE